MPDDILNKVAEQLFAYAEVVDLRGFGESALDNRLLAQVDALNAAGVKTKIITNLAPRSPEWWIDFGRRDILIGISLEAASPELYETTRRGAKHSTFLANLAALRAGQEQRGASDDIYFNVTVSDETIDEVSPLVELAADHGVPLITLNPIFHEAPEGGLRIGVSPPKVARLNNTLRQARELADRRGVELRVGANLAMGCSALGGYEQCIHPWSYVYIRYDGGIGFCDHLTTHDAAIFGSLADSDFMTVWNGPDYRRLRDDHGRRDFDRLTGLGLECDWCYRNRFTDGEYLIEPGKELAVLGRTVTEDQLLPIASVREGGR